MTVTHIDYFVLSSVAPGVNGHQFYLHLISSIGGQANKESFMELVQLYLIQLQ
jgi:hypothetical protein